MENENKNINESIETTTEKKTNWVNELISWIQVLATASVIAFVLTTFIIANSEVPTSSMENTIMAGSRVIGSRLHYKFSEPEHGDVAIFVWGWQCPGCGLMGEDGINPPSCPRCTYNISKKTHKVYYVKRIIGLPGDVIDIVSLRSSGGPLFHDGRQQKLFDGCPLLD